MNSEVGVGALRHCGRCIVVVGGGVRRICVAKGVGNCERGVGSGPEGDVVCDHGGCAAWGRTLGSALRSRGQFRCVFGNLGRLFCVTVGACECVVLELESEFEE